MGNSYLAPGDVVTFTAPSGGVTKGIPVLIGATVVIPAETAAQTVTFSAYVSGIHSVPKTDSQAWAEGALLYLDNSGHCFTTSATSNVRAGFAVEAVASTGGLTTGKIRLSGVPAVAGTA
jgi:predicted RecA/RadA family phage recombinase